MNKKNIQVNSNSKDIVKNKYFNNGNFHKEKSLDKQGSALLMAILILSSIIAVSFSVSRMVMTAIETGGVQAQSVMAYYSAETGAERVLYGIRHGGLSIDENNPNFFNGTNVLNNNSEYIVFAHFSPLKIISVGSFGSTKRSVELSF